MGISKEDFRLLPDADPITGESKNFYGPEFENDVVILACIDCILGWALSVESSINLICITNEKTKNIEFLNKLLKENYNV